MSKISMMVGLKPDRFHFMKSVGVHRIGEWDYYTDGENVKERGILP